MIKISQFPIEIQVHFNHISSDKFKNLNIDKQMSLSCDWDEPQS